jgi:hypothetical protein
LLAMHVAGALAACSSEAVHPPAKAPSTPAVVVEQGPAAPMPPEQVLFSLRGKESSARRCFENPSPQRGFVRVGFRIGTSGNVQDPEVEHATVTEPSVATCLTQFVSDLHFDPQAAPTPASWTFVYGVGDPQILVDAEKRAKVHRKNGKARRGFEKPQGKRARGRNRGPVFDRDSQGSLPRERLESVVEAGFSLYAHCLREGVGRNRYLSGRVLLHFAIDAAGRVSEVSDGGSDLPDLDAIDCVAQGFYALRFPAPDGGPVGVTYPILLNEE